MALPTKHDEWIYAVVDVADNSTTVFSGPCLLKGIAVNTALSAHACPVKDNTTTVMTLPASAAIGWFEYGGVAFATSLVIDPNDAGTGSITVVYKPFYI